MRYYLSRLVNKNVRATGYVSYIKRVKPRSIFKRNKPYTDYMITLTNVKIDQVNGEIDHLNIFLPIDTDISQLRNSNISVVAKVVKYFRAPNKDFIYGYDYGLNDIKEITIK